MLDTLFMLPVGFWASAVLIGWGVIWALGQLRQGIGIPVIMVMGTVAVWYLGDALYNNYRTTHLILFKADVLAEAWWQVALFLAAFLLLVSEVNRWMNHSLAGRSSQIIRMYERGTDQAQFQLALGRLLIPCLIVWAILTVVAAIRLKGEYLYYLAPFLSYRANPWERGRIGAGMDFALSFAGYLELFIAVMFGVLAALLKDTRLRLAAFFGVAVTWPFYIFDRTRNTMLAIFVPAVLAWVFLRLRLPSLQKLAILAGFFVIINAWLAFVIAHRSSMGIASAFIDEGFDVGKNTTVHHEGLTMFQELCWINTFIDNGTYTPNWGKRYFAEIVNPIPRSIWPDKPQIGIDYAVLRGQAYEEGSGGVGATISTGMIGQGVVNFGTLLGPVFAAFLMSIWVAILARFDLSGQGIGRIPLYGLGLILTFNLGRDITLITLYTFVFGVLLILLLELYLGTSPAKKTVQGPPRPYPATSSSPVLAKTNTAQTTPSRSESGN